MAKMKVIQISILRTGLVVVIGKSSQDIYKLVELKENKKVKDFLHKQLGDYTYPEDADGFVTLSNKNEPLLIFIKEKKSKLELLGVLVHEINHTVEYFADIMDFQEEKEFKAYLSQQIFTDIADGVL